MPSPIPVIEVNSGCAKPVSGTRRMKMTVTTSAPGGDAACWAPAA